MSCSSQRRKGRLPSKMRHPLTLQITRMNIVKTTPMSSRIEGVTAFAGHSGGEPIERV